MKTQLRYKQDFEKRIRVSNHNILTVQYIYLDPRDGEKIHGKLGPIAEGPYRVLLKNKRIFVIQRGDVVERVNSDRATYAPPHENAPPILRFEASTTDILEKNIDGQTYLVDKLLEHSIHDDGSMHFLVKWIAYPELSWQPRSDIPENFFLDTLPKFELNKIVQLQLNRLGCKLCHKYSFLLKINVYEDVHSFEGGGPRG